MRPEKVMRRLRESLDGRRIATVVRDEFEAVMTDGFVIAIGDEWVALHSLLAGVHLDDIVLLRLSDVSRVWFRDDDAYHHRAIESLGATVASLDCTPGATTADLIALAGKGDRIFAVHFETEDDLVIGRLLELRKKSFDVHYVGRDGVWANEVERWRYEHVTRIELGGRYLDALNRFSDPYPVIPRPES